ncbi:hypothetical protein JCM3770_001265 [Rhodotorula araucariae]
MRTLLTLATAATLVSLACAAPLACGARQYLAGSVCKPCPVNMASCSSATTALSCMRGRYLTTDKRCVLARECPENTFADASSHVATTCPGQHAKACDAAGSTTVCAADFHLTNDGTCVQCIGSQEWNEDWRACTLSCRAGSLSLAPDGTVIVDRATFPDQATETCKLCKDEGAWTCDSAGVSGYCLEGWNLSADNACVKCANGENWDDQARTCKAPAPVCENAHNIVTGYTDPEPAPFPGMPSMPAQAQIELVEATYLDASTNTCVKCPGSSAYSCDSTGRTTACYNSYLINGECTWDCNGDGAAAQTVPAPPGFTYAPMPWIGYRIGFFGLCRGYN